MSLTGLPASRVTGVCSAAPGLSRAHAVAQEQTCSGRSAWWKKLDVSSWAAVLIAVVGVVGLYRPLVVLWGVWTGDPLRSIGILIPPASILLTIRAWKQCQWERNGSWWGLPLILLSFLIGAGQRHILLLGVLGNVNVSLIPCSTSLYLYGSGLILLFAGWRVWRQAWFPLLLLMLSQPVPVLTLGLIDGPLQRVAAEVARSFATMIGFAPSTPELRLMFSPHFGMFIAPGCDGIRGAVTMGYIALIVGYLKRVSIPRWVLYVSGAVLLGYIFNFLRLCLLVIYYRISIGHRPLERLGTEADYVIGFCLFSIATILVVWAARRKNSTTEPAESVSEHIGSQHTPLGWKAAALAALVVLTIAVQARELIRFRQAARNFQPFTDRLPRHIGAYQLTGTKYEQSAGQRMVAAGIYSAPGLDPVTFGVWIAPTSWLHDANACWLLRGLKPSERATTPFAMAHRTSANFDVGFYNEADSDTVVANTFCTAQGCNEFKSFGTGNHSGLVLLKPEAGLVAGEVSHPVSFMIRIDRAHSADSRSAVYEDLSAEAKRFAENLDLPGLTRTFQ